MKNHLGTHGLVAIVSGSQITIDFANTSLDLKTLLERTEEMLPLLHALISADEAWFKLNNNEKVLRGRGYVTMNMLCQSATQIATEKAKLLKAIADGSELIEDHGFPEYDDKVLHQN
jgi:hypothetical protein